MYSVYSLLSISTVLRHDVNHVRRFHIHVHVGVNMKFWQLLFSLLVVLPHPKCTSLHILNWSIHLEKRKPAPGRNGQGLVHKPNKLGLTFTQSLRQQVWHQLIFLQHFFTYSYIYKFYHNHSIFHP